jgi:hypothetical protein
MSMQQQLQQQQQQQHQSLPVQSIRPIQPVQVFYKIFLIYIRRIFIFHPLEKLTKFFFWGGVNLALIHFKAGFLALNNVL